MNDIKKIVIATTALMPFDAVSNYVCTLAKQLSESSSIRIFTFTLSDHFDAGIMPQRNVAVSFYAKTQGHTLWHEIKTIIFPFNLSKELMKNDLLLIATCRPTFVPILLAKILKPKLTMVWDFHGITPPAYSRGIRRHLLEILRVAIVKQLMKHCDFCIVHSSFMKNEVQRLFGVESVVIPLAADTIRFHPNVSRKLERTGLQQRFTLLYVGRLVRHKRVDFIIRSLAELRDPSVNLLIAGSGYERSDLEKLAKSLDLADQVFFLGAVPDEELPDLYNASDAFVTASLHEGVCVPILESFASGKPVIVPNNTAMPETAKNGGLVYDTDSVRDLADKIRMLQTNKHLRFRLQENALAIASRVSFAKTLGKYESYMKEITRTKARPNDRKRALVRIPC